jgi:hypothetical protein
MGEEILGVRSEGYLQLPIRGLHNPDLKNPGTGHSDQSPSSFGGRYPSFKMPFASDEHPPMDGGPVVRDGHQCGGPRPFPPSRERLPGSRSHTDRGRTCCHRRPALPCQRQSTLPGCTQHSILVRETTPILPDSLASIDFPSDPAVPGRLVGV